MVAVRTFLSKHITTLLLAVILSLAFTAKYALDARDRAVEAKVHAEQQAKQVAAELAQERFQTQTLTEALLERDRRLEALQRANAALSQEVDHASDQHPEWSGTRTPDSVLDSLCGTLNCSRDTGTRGP